MCASSLFRIWRNQLYSPSRKATDGRQQPAARAPEVLKKKTRKELLSFFSVALDFFFPLLFGTILVNISQKRWCLERDPAAALYSVCVYTYIRI